MKTIDRSELPEVGAPLGGGYFTAIFLLNGLYFAMATIGKEGEVRASYGSYGEEIPGANSFVDGYNNTLAMAAAGNETAKKILAMRIGGQDDWVWPARNQEEAQYRVFKPTAQKNYRSYLDGYNPDTVPAGELYTETNPPQTTIEAFREGGAEAFTDGIYLSSTHNGAHGAFIQLFNGGCQDCDSKGSDYHVRPVRMIQIIN